MQIIPTPSSVAASSERLASIDEWHTAPIHLDKGTENPLSVMMFEGSGKPGKGMKYSCHDIIIVLEGTFPVLLGAKGRQ